jgi:hypothetical protein
MECQMLKPSCVCSVHPTVSTHVTPRGFAGPNLLAMILFEKFDQHTQPLNRPERTLRPGGIVLSLSTLADRSVPVRWPLYGLRVVPVDGERPLMLQLFRQPFHADVRARVHYEVALARIGDAGVIGRRRARLET